MTSSESNILDSVTHLSLTKLDILSGLPEIRIGVDHERVAGGDRFEGKPVYETLPGWSEDITQCRRWEDLPANAQAYVQRIEHLVGVRAGLISVGPGREEVIPRDELFQTHPFDT